MILSEINQNQKRTFCTISFIWRWKKQQKTELPNVPDGSCVSGLCPINPADTTLGASAGFSEVPIWLSSRNLERSGQTWLSRWDSNRDWKWSRRWRTPPNGMWWVLVEPVCGLFLALLPAQKSRLTHWPWLRRQKLAQRDMLAFMKLVVFVLFVGANHCDRNILYHRWTRRTLCSFQGELPSKFVCIQGIKKFTLIIKFYIFPLHFLRESLSYSVHK